MFGPYPANQNDVDIMKTIIEDPDGLCKFLRMNDVFVHDYRGCRGCKICEFSPNNLWNIFPKYFGEYFLEIGNFPKNCGNFIYIFWGNILQKLGIFQNIWGIFLKNCEFSIIIVEISSTYFCGIFPKIGSFPKIL